MPHTNTRMAIIDISQFLDMVLPALRPTLSCIKIEAALWSTKIIDASNDPGMTARNIAHKGTFFRFTKLPSSVTPSVRNPVLGKASL